MNEQQTQALATFLATFLAGAPSTAATEATAYLTEAANTVAQQWLGANPESTDNFWLRGQEG